MSQLVCLSYRGTPHRVPFQVQKVSDAERLLASEMEYGISEPNEVFVEVIRDMGGAGCDTLRVHVC